MTHPMVNARLRPMIAPTFAPVIISDAITSVYAVIAPWMPVTVVPTSFATVAIETFITELSRVIRNCPLASVNSTSVAPPARADGATGGAGVARVPLDAVIAIGGAQVRAASRSSLWEAVIALLLTAVVDVAAPEQGQGEEQERPEAAPGVPRPAQHDEQQDTNEHRAHRDPHDREPEPAPEPAPFSLVVRHVAPSSRGSPGRALGGYRSQQPGLLRGELAVG